MASNEHAGNVENRMVGIGQRIAADKYEHCTADPIFLVEQKIRDYGYDSEYTSTFDWIDAVEGHPIEKHRADRLTKLDDNGRNVDKRYTRAYYNDRWEFVTACLTRDGAEAFVRRQKHNLKETRIWVGSLFRNQEMIDVREYLKSKSTTPTTEAQR